MSQNAPDKPLWRADMSLPTVDRRVTQAGVALQVCHLVLDTGRENIAVVYAGSTAFGTLADADLEGIVRHITGYRYVDVEIAAFLVGAAGFTSTDELLALTRAMTDAGTRLSWQTPLIVDKNCIGGIPGC